VAVQSELLKVPSLMMTDAESGMIAAASQGKRSFIGVVLV
jgi:hypothetical protein